MKTNEQKTNATNGKSFFQKMLILLAIVALSGLGYKAQAQNSVHLNVSNSSGCTWTVTLYDAGMNFLQSWSVTAAGLTSFCTVNYATAVEYVTVDDGTCVLTFGTGGGNFPYTNVSSPCGGTTCSSAVDCSGGVPSICSPPATDPWIIIRIF